jgi:transcriptional regulator GlxA family with amidase domain
LAEIEQQFNPSDRSPMADGNHQSINRPPPKRIAMLIYSGVTPMDVAGPLEVFSFANVLRKEILYDVVTVAPTAGPVTTKAGVGFMPTCAMADLALPVDTLMVSGGMRPRSWVTPDLIDWLRHAAPRARRFGSICTGAFLLGAAGLLDGRRVTTHWAACEDLARSNPAARVEVDPIFIREAGFFSIAGISAGIDLALALVEEDHGREFALHIARYLVLYLKRSGGQAIDTFAVAGVGSAGDRAGANLVPGPSWRRFAGEHVAPDRRHERARLLP